MRGAFEEVSSETPAAETETPAAAPADRQPTTSGEPKAEHPTDPTRYADGKFKPTKEDVPQQAANEQHAKAALEQQPQPQTQAPALNLSVPPSSWPAAAKAEWDKLPEVVRAANVQREIDISNGHAKYETTKELIPFVDLARSQGQSPREVIERYIGAENHLRQDFIGGMVNIGGGMGYTPQQIALAMAQRYLGQSNGQTPDGYQQPSDPQQGSQTPGYDPAYLQQYINPLEQDCQERKPTCSSSGRPNRTGRERRQKRPRAGRVRSRLSLFRQRRGRRRSCAAAHECHRPAYRRRRCGSADGLPIGVPQPP